jgi:ankyrin repeat protein
VGENRDLVGGQGTCGQGGERQHCIWRSLKGMAERLRSCWRQADVKKENNRGWTAFHLAASEGHDRVFRIFFRPNRSLLDTGIREAVKLHVMCRLQ